MKKQIIEAERLSDEKQVKVISEVFGLTIEKATEMADAIYKRGMEIVRTEGRRADGTTDFINHEPIYYITKKFLQGGVTIRQLAVEEGIGYTKLYEQIKQEVKRVTGEKPYLNAKSYRDKYIEFFK